MKKFWKRTEGFTLVELVVVIAILGVLAGVGTVGYSGYVKKANMAADQQLARDTANALTLHAYNHDNLGKTGFVVLTTDGAVGDGKFGDAAMEATFGSEWAATAKLKYGGWTSVVPSIEDVETVKNSSYYKNSTPAALVQSFSTLTDSLSGMAATASQDPLITLSTLGGGSFMSEDEVTAMRDQLDALGVSWGKDKDAYTTAIANLLVKKTADEIGSFDIDGGSPLSGMSNLAITYAILYGWGTSTPEGRVVLDALNATLTDPDTDSGDVIDAVNSAMEAAGSTENEASYQKYSVESEGADSLAIISIMEMVSDWSDGADMTSSGLYSSASITDTVNAYVGAVSAISGLDAEQKAVWEEWAGQGQVVYVDATGMAYSPMLSD